MTKLKRRKLNLVVISDIHLGTYGCHAKELLQYLKSINPETLVLNGDIIDIWQFSKHYWPKSHMKVIKQLSSMMTKGVKIYYVTGNHDEMMRKFVGFKIGSFKIVNKLLLNLDGKKAWIFHGDVFDVSMQYSKWLTKLGAIGYDFLILLNSLINYFSLKFGRGKISLSKTIKNSVKSAVKFINNFEEICSDIAIENNYDYVVCGHIHNPDIKQISNNKGSVLYLNSGDWVENLTALEYNDNAWSLYRYSEDDYAPNIKSKMINKAEMSYNELFEQLILELKISKPK